MSNMAGEIVRGYRKVIGDDWDPRWSKGPEELSSPCPKGHVDRDVTRSGHLFCRTCERTRLAKK